MSAFITPRDKKNISANRPVDMFSAMRSEMDRMFERFHANWPSLPQMFGAAGSDVQFPSLDFKDNGTSFIIEAELPGVEDKDVAVTVADRVLTIKGEKRQSREETVENSYLSERSYGSFVRSLQLPHSVDENTIEATFDKGVLKITAAKRAEAVAPEKKIEIKSP
jgi:HSP20 family protein